MHILFECPLAKELWMLICNIDVDNVKPLNIIGYWLHTLDTKGSSHLIRQLALT